MCVFSSMLKRVRGPTVHKSSHKCSPLCSAPRLSALLFSWFNLSSHILSTSPLSYIAFFSALLFSPFFSLCLSSSLSSALLSYPHLSLSTLLLCSPCLSRLHCSPPLCHATELIGLSLTLLMLRGAQRAIMISPVPKCNVASLVFCMVMSSILFLSLFSLASPLLAVLSCSVLDAV